MEERSVSLAKKYAALAAMKCSVCAKMRCTSDHAICIRCNKTLNLDSIPGECTEGGKTLKRHTYSF